MVVSSSIVLIGPAHALPALCERLDSGAELHTFTDGEALEALDHVIRIKPRIVALEKDFSATSRGRALINRITDDPTLGGSEIRVVTHETSATRIAARRPGVPGAALAVDDPAPALQPTTSHSLDQRGTRRAARVPVREGVEVLVDGNPAALVDISTVGVQVLSPKLLRPNQRVRVALPEGATAIRCDGSIAWAAFEMPKGLPPRYRAGIELAGADPLAVSRYANRHKDS
jgi:hypothetical protein